MSLTFKYLNNTYQFTDEATIKKVSSDERGNYFILDNTIFYPQGGGQPSDLGKIHKKEQEYKVTFVAFVDGDIRHYYLPTDSSLNPGDNIHLSVQEDNRILNAKSHTAGHLVQAVIESKPNDLIALKGYHFPNGSYVEFMGTKPTDPDLFIKEVNDTINQFITEGREIITKIVSLDELKKVSKYVPEGLPQDKPLRIVIVDGINLAVPCGGTHLNNTNELESLSVSKIKSRKGNSKVSYVFS